MLAQIVKWLLLTVFLLDNLITNKQVLADDGPQPPPPIAFTNVNTLSAGSAFTIKCNMPDNYTIGNKQFIMYFGNTISNSWFSEYFISALTTNQRERKLHLNVNNADLPYISSVQQVNSTTDTSNTFEIIVTTTKKTFSAQFYCFAQYNLVDSAYSNKVPITTLPLPPPTLISSVNHVPLHYPFTLTCSLSSQFNPNNGAYQVAFFNSRDGLLADYKIDEHGKVFLFSKEFSNVSAHHGIRKSFPTFDLVVRENGDRKLSYWCELFGVDPTTQKNIIFESAHWKPVGPFVDFSSSSNATIGVERRGRCSIDELNNISNKEYQVLFYSDFGTKTGSDNLLGYFWVFPHDIVEFVAETVTHWTSIVNGASVEYPHFEIVGTLESSSLSTASSHQWWCALNFTESGQSSARLVKSNLEAL